MLEPEKLAHELKLFQQELARYKKDRQSNRWYALKDPFRRNPNDPNSITRRMLTIECLQQEIEQVVLFSTKPQSEAFQDAAVTLVESLCQKIEQISDRSSQQRKLLSKHRGRIIREIMNNIKDESVKIQIKQINLRHMNALLADRIVEYKQARLEDIITHPSHLFSRVRDFFYPKSRDKHMEELNGLISQLKGCTTAGEYADLIEKSDSLITQYRKTDKTLAEKLAQIQKPIQRMLKANEIPSGKNITKIAPSTINTQPLDDKMAYFQKKMSYQLTYHLLAHGIASLGILKHEEGWFGRLGVTICSIDPGVPFGRVVPAIVGQALIVGEEHAQATKDQLIAEKIPHHVLDKVVMIAAEKLTHHYAAQISLLYHSPLYTRAMDKLVKKMIENIMENLQQNHEIVLSDKNQIGMYKELIELKRKQGRLNAEQQHQLDLLHAEILADHVADGVHKSLTRMPMAGWFSTTHLMHNDDENALFGGKELNVFSMFEKPGRVIVRDDGSVQFFSGTGLDPDKYGYVFSTPAEVKKLGLRPQKDVDIKIHKHYLALHQSYTVKNAATSHTAAPQVAVEPTPTSQPIVAPIDTQAKLIAGQLIAYWKQMMASQKTFTSTELQDLRQKITSINQQLKQDKALKGHDVKIGEAVFPLHIFVKSVEKRLDELQAAQLASALSSSLNHLIPTSPSTCGAESEKLRDDKRPILKVV
jgi:hypothetical protein